MGSSPYWYYVKYEDDKNNALKKLRQREFEAGRYNPVIDFPEFPITEETASPGKGHESIADALNESEADGTRSILDLEKVSENNDYCIARILSKKELLEYFDTEKPTKEIIEKCFDNFIDDIERGKGFCITVYENDIPSELFFIGYSFD
jgi:hypothetical protein